LGESPQPDNPKGGLSSRERKPLGTAAMSIGVGQIESHPGLLYGIVLLRFEHNYGKT